MCIYQLNKAVRRFKVKLQADYCITEYKLSNGKDHSCAILNGLAFFSISKYASPIAFHFGIDGPNLMNANFLLSKTYLNSLRLKADKQRSCWGFLIICKQTETRL